MEDKHLTHAIQEMQKKPMERQSIPEILHMGCGVKDNAEIKRHIDFLVEKGLIERKGYYDQRLTAKGRNFYGDSVYSFIKSTASEREKKKDRYIKIAIAASSIILTVLGFILKKHLSN